MPAVDWYKHEGQTYWYKVCSRCKTEFTIEAEDFACAVVSMKEFFPHSALLKPYDGLSSWCRSCTAAKHHQRDIGIHRDEMLLSQEGKCMLCPREVTFKNRRAHVDHDHITKAIRAVLCPDCNRRMAGVDDDDWLAKAVAYRDFYRKKDK